MIVINGKPEDGCGSLKVFSKVLPVNLFAMSKLMTADMPVAEIRTALLKNAHRVTQFTCAQQPG
jgi:hypothetical protein